MSYIKNIYRSLCARIYAVGKYYTGEKDRITIGRNSHIYGSLTILPFGGRIIIGNNCSLGDLSRIVSGKSIVIGNRVMIAHNVNILDNNSHPTNARLRHEDFIANYS